MCFSLIQELTSSLSAEEKESVQLMSVAFGKTVKKVDCRVRPVIMQVNKIPKTPMGNCLLLQNVNVCTLPQRVHCG